MLIRKASFWDQKMWDWIVAAIIFFLLIYTMIIVIKEKKEVEKNFQQFEIGDYSFRVPLWWSHQRVNDVTLKFVRTDTRYDWYTLVQILKENKKTPKEIIEDYLSNNKIILDFDLTWSCNTNSIELKVSGFNFERVEGTGTQDASDRVYIDIIVLEAKNTQDKIIFVGQSSVLNGGIEGPYFEMAVQSLSQQNKSV